MLDIHALNDRLSVAAQIKPEDVPDIVARGFKAILCNRPDGESVDQPAFGAVERAAQEAGIEFVYQPVVSGFFDERDVDEFGQILERLPGPVLAYCRTGTRCTVLWSMSEVTKGTPRQSVLESALQAGYDMSRILP